MSEDYAPEMFCGKCQHLKFWMAAGGAPNRAFDFECGRLINGGEHIPLTKSEAYSIDGRSEAYRCDLCMEIDLKKEADDEYDLMVKLIELDERLRRCEELLAI